MPAYQATDEELVSRNMDEDCQITRMHAEHQETSVPGASRHRKHETRFVTSTVRLPSAQKQQRWGFLSLQPWKAHSKPQAAVLLPKHAYSSTESSSQAPSKQPGPPLSRKAASISKSVAPIITADAGSLFFLDDSSTEGSSQSTAEQHGPAQATAISSSKASRPDSIPMSYVLNDTKGEPGIVPLITVGSVFTLVKARRLKPTREEEIAFGRVVEMLSRVSSEAATRYVERVEREGLGTPMRPLLAIQGGKLAFWLSEEIALRAAKLRDVFEPVPASNATGERSMGQASSATSTVRRAFPRPPAFLLPKHFWLPGARLPEESSDESEAGPAKDRLASSKIITIEDSLISFIGRLKGASECQCPYHFDLGRGIQLEPDQVKCARTTQAAWQHAQQDLHARDPLSTTDGRATSAPNSAHDDDLAKEGSLPVYSVPGIHINLPTLGGTISFTPVFLSKEQLDKTWAAVRATHWRWVVRTRRKERRHLRQTIELVVATLAAVRPTPPPGASSPAAAAAAHAEEDEDSMDEPPEVKQFMQELGEGGPRAGVPNLSNDGLPMGGLGYTLVSCATGTLSLGMRCIESLCNQADSLIGLTPIGRRALGSLPDPLVRVDSLSTLAAQIDAQNTRIITSEMVEEDGPQQEEEDPPEGPASQASPGNSNAGKDPPAGGYAGSPEEATFGKASSNSRKGSAEQEGSRGQGRSRVDLGHPAHGRAAGRPSEMKKDAAGHHARSDDGGMDIGKPDDTSAEECPSEAAPSSMAGQQQAGKRKWSRLRTLISIFRRGKPLQAATHSKDTATSTEAAPEAQSVDHSSTQPVQHSTSPSDEPLTTASPAVPKQGHGLFSQPDETRAPKTAASSHGVSREAAESEDINAYSMANSGAGAESSAEEESDGRWSVYVDWAEMNKSMMDSMHKLVSTMTAALVIQSLGLDTFAVPGLKFEKVKGTSSAASKAENGSTDHGSAIVPYDENMPAKLEDAAGPAHTSEGTAGEESSPVEIIWSTEEASGLARAQDDENTLKGLLMIGHLDIDVEGKQLPWPMPTVGFGNGAHLAFRDLRCSSGAARK